ncbi:hypothetical protein ACQCN2_16740 [Brevibacillus ginsengisoli]|uniref:hypothetical protein n=1 Tax=Brevibacillus ginsengisoli TaxID=363854 RepID=UPI003CF3EE02
MRYGFELDHRLGIPLPSLKQEWEDYTAEERASILLEWEEIRARIPDRIKELEVIINHKQNALSVEDNFQVSCQLNSEIAELASVINDLHIWFRIQQDHGAKTHQ